MRFFNFDVSAVGRGGAQLPSVGHRQEGLSVKFNPPGIYRDGKEIEINSIEDHHALKEVINKLHQNTKGPEKEAYAKMINYVDQKLLGQAVRTVGNDRIVIFGKAYDVPNAKNLAEAIKNQIRGGKDNLAQNLIKSAAQGTTIREIQKGDINRDGKYQVGEQIYFFHQGKKLEGTVYEVKEENGKKTLMVAAGQENVFKVTADIVNGKDDLKKAKVESLGSKWFIGGQIQTAQNSRAALRAEGVLKGQDSYGLSQYGKEGVRTSDKLVGFQRVMSQLEQDVCNFCSSEQGNPKEISNYLNRMKSVLKSAGFSDQEVNLMMTRILKEAQKTLNQKIHITMTNRASGPEYWDKQRNHFNEQLQGIESYSQKNGINLKADSIPFEQIWKMIAKPLTNFSQDKAVTAEWMTKNVNGKSKWDAEKQKISKDTAVDAKALADASRSLISRYGSGGLQVAGLENIKLKETRVLLPEKQKQGVPQTIKEHVIAGFSPAEQKYIVIEPATGNRFVGNTEDEAMAAYGKGAALDANSVIAYRDSKGVLREQTIEYSIQKRQVDVLYRVAVAAVIIGSVVATAGSSTAGIVALVAGATMTVIDTGELIIKASDGREVKWTEYAMAGADVLMGVLLPAGQVAKLGKLAKAERAVQFLAKNNLIDASSVKTLNELKKTNPAKYQEEVNKLINQTATQNPRPFAEAVAQEKNAKITVSNNLNAEVAAPQKVRQGEVVLAKTNRSQVQAAFQTRSKISTKTLKQGPNEATQKKLETLFHDRNMELEKLPKEVQMKIKQMREAYAHQSRNIQKSEGLLEDSAVYLKMESQGLKEKSLLQTGNGDRVYLENFDLAFYKDGKLTSEKMTLMVKGDVSGHGIEASAHSFTFDQAHLIGMKKMKAGGPYQSPEQAFDVYRNARDRVAYNLNGDRSKFMTATDVLIERKNGQALVGGSGGEPIYVRGQDGAITKHVPNDTAAAGMMEQEDGVARQYQKFDLNKEKIHMFSDAVDVVPADQLQAWLKEAHQKGIDLDSYVKKMVKEKGLEFKDDYSYMELGGTTPSRNKFQIKEAAFDPKSVKGRIDEYNRDVKVLAQKGDPEAVIQFYNEHTLGLEMKLDTVQIDKLAALNGVDRKGMTRLLAEYLQIRHDGSMSDLLTQQMNLLK